MTVVRFDWAAAIQHFTVPPGVTLLSVKACSADGGLAWGDISVSTGQVYSLRVNDDSNADVVTEAFFYCPVGTTSIAALKATGGNRNGAGTVNSTYFIAPKGTGLNNTGIDRYNGYLTITYTVGVTPPAALSGWGIPR